MSDFPKGAVALISGASRGIGDHVARGTVAAGLDVSLGMRTPVMPAWAKARRIASSSSPTRPAT